LLSGGHRTWFSCRHEKQRPDESAVDRGDSGPESPGLLVRLDSLAVEGWSFSGFTANRQRLAIPIGTSKANPRVVFLRCVRDSDSMREKPGKRKGLSTSLLRRRIPPRSRLRRGSAGSSSGSAQRRENGFVGERIAREAFRFARRDSSCELLNARR